MSKQKHACIGVSEELCVPHIDANGRKRTQDGRNAVRKGTEDWEKTSQIIHKLRKGNTSEVKYNIRLCSYKYK